MSQPETNRNLLFAIMAVQMDFVPRDAIVSTVLAWIGNKDVPLGQVLVDRGELSPARRILLDQLLDEHIKAHAGDPARSLQALSSTDGVGEILTRVPDAQWQASLGNLRDAGRAEPDARDIPTRAPAPGDIPTRIPDDGGAGGPWKATLAPWGNRFRVVRKHAEGGLGVVSVAIDDELDREVAYKEIKPRHADHRTSQARFVMEAEITGKLEHPGIVPIYGLGHDLQGRPYYAMRFIQGDSLAEAINRFHDPDGPFAEPGKRTLQLRELLGRFLDVCDALAYAHSRGVLHRDLKPGNVMLGPFGETLVVDWGLALNLKEIPGDLESPHAPLKTSKADTDSLPSEQGSIVGTLPYMPPEQAEGAIDRLGPRSDVYGLGAILYDLLTGRHPVTGTTQQELIQAVRGGKLAPPRQIRGDIPRPLEAICLKALSLRPDDRYATPRALASDIKSFLADEPVTAYREPLTDRLRRWSRRHRALVSTLAATLVVGVLGLGSTLAVLTAKNRELFDKNGELTQAINDIDRQKQRAQEREQEAINAIKKFRDSVLNEPLLRNTPDLDALRKRLLQEPLTYFKSLRERLQGDGDTRPESLERLADAAYELGELSNQIGNKDDALAAYREALSGYRRIVSNAPANASHQSRLASIHNDMGVILSTTGKQDDALRAYEEAREIREALAKENPTVAVHENDLAGTYVNIGILFREVGKVGDALKAHERARGIQERLATQNPADASYKDDLATSYNNIGLLLAETGRTDDALAAYGRARDLRKDLTRENPFVIAYYDDLAMIQNNLGGLLSEIGRKGDAIEAYEEARKIRESLAKQNPTVTAYRHGLALTYHNIGLLLSQAGKAGDALKAQERAREILEPLARQNPSVAGYQSDLALSDNSIGNLMSEMGKAGDALKVHERASGILEALVKQNPTVAAYRNDLAGSYDNRGNLMTEAGRVDDALRMYERARDIQEELVAQNPSIPAYRSGLARSSHHIGLLLGDMGKSGEALKAYERARDLQEELVRRHPEVAEFRGELAVSHVDIGILLKQTGKAGESMKAYERARDLQLRLVAAEPENPSYASDLGTTFHNMANILSSSNRLAEARLQFREAIALQRKALGALPDHPEYRRLMASHLSGLRTVCRKLDDRAGMAEAERELRALKESDPATKAIDGRLSSILKGLERPVDASERLKLGQRAYDRSLHATAARFWDEAFAASPDLVEDRKERHRYDAACAAALAGTGQGKDDPAPGEAEKARLRGKALGWLRGELKAWEGVLGSGKEMVRKALEHWKRDPDLAGVREEKALAKLPEAERVEWVKLWGEVEGLLKRAK